jgi:Protein of unknown function (DUF1326)
MAYDVQGQFYEACDCEIICSCWAGVPPDMGSCTGLFAWEIQTGNSNGVDMAGARSVMITQGTSCDDSDNVLILVDGTPAQRAELRDAMSRGDWAKVVKVASTCTPEYQDAAIAIGLNQVTASLLTAKRSIEVEANYNFSDVPIEISDTAPARLVAKVTGSAPSTVQVGGVVSVGQTGLNILAEVQAPGKPAYLFDLDVTQVTAMRGAFRYSQV